MSQSHSTAPRALAYYRMSTDDQENSIPQQKDWARRTAARESLSLLAEFQDDGVSGSKTEQRTGLMAALREAEDAAERGEPYDVLLAWDMDRWSRADSWRTGAVMARLMDAGVGRVITNADGVVDLADETHRVLFNLKQDLGRNAYLRSLSANVLRGMTQSAAGGKFMGKAPLGDVKGADGRLVPDGGEGEGAIKRLFAWCLAGTSLLEMTRKMNQLGPKPARGKMWSRTAVRFILKNRVYTGALVWNAYHHGGHHRAGRSGVKKDAGAPAREAKRRRRNLKNLPREANAPEDIIVVENAHPALVSAEDFAAAGRSLSARFRKPSGRGKTGEHWVLSGLLYCQCGNVMHGIPRTVKRATRVYYYRKYRCSAKNYLGLSACPDTGECGHDWAVREAARLLKERLGSPEAAAEIRARMALAIASRKRDGEREAKALLEKARDLDGWIVQGNKNLALLPADRIMGVVEQIRSWEQERRAVGVRLAELDEARANQAAPSLEAAEEALSLIGKLEEVIAGGEPLAVRQALCPLVKKLTLTFWPSTPEERRKGVNGGPRFVPDVMKLELHEVLLNLFSPANCSITPTAPPPRR